MWSNPAFLFLQEPLVHKQLSLITKTSLRDLDDSQACHALNRLYLHHLLKKTSYELLTGNKPNVSYFRVFGS
jgi:hypothetical protein